MVRLSRGVVALLGAAGSVAAVSAAWADSYPPFYGYSGYFGGPTVYYTADPDVQQATTSKDAYLGFGVRTYTTGGPFYTYAPARTFRDGGPVRHRRSRVVRVRG